MRLEKNNAQALFLPANRPPGKALAVVGEVKGAAWAVQELEGKGKPRKNPWAAWGAACRALDWHSYRQQRVWVP